MKTILTNWIRKLGKQLAILSENLTNWFKKLVQLSPKTVAWCIKLQAKIWKKWSKNRLLVGFCSALDKLSKKFPNRPKDLLITSEVLLLIPNLLSLARLLIVPLFVIGWRIDASKWFFLITYLFLMALDLLDGPIARQANLNSELGKSLDPMADKISLLMMATIGVALFQLVPLWLLIVLLTKNLLISLAAPFFKNQNNGAGWWGKLGGVVEVGVLTAALTIIVPNWVFVSLAVIEGVVLTTYLIVFLRRPQVAVEEKEKGKQT